MHVVPAVDIKQSKVVRAVAGKRSSYRPIESQLASGSAPASIGAAFRDQLGLTQVYLADLDAIEGAEPAWDVYMSLIQCGLNLWIDAGLNGQPRAERMMEFAQDHPEVNGIIGATESLPDLATLASCLEVIGSDRFIFSIDLQDGLLITAVDDWRDMLAAEVTASVIEHGVTRLILLDLASVGMHDGCGTRRICKRLRKRFPDVALYTGGGIRGLDDLDDLAAAGCTAAFVSSSLHDGCITAENLRAFNEPADPDD